MTTPRRMEHRSDDGHEVVVCDVVDGCFPELVDPLAGLISTGFPLHPFAAERTRADAVLPSVRQGIIVHQWVVLVDGRPVGALLFDCNVPRNCIPMYFVYVEPDARPVTLDGIRLGEWLLRRTSAEMTNDGYPGSYGGFGEVPFDMVPYYERTGWRTLSMTYPEPVHGWDWPELGLEFRTIALIWLPNPAIDADAVAHLVTAPGAASFLLDTYGVPPDAPEVAAMIGDEAGRPGGRREPPAVSPDASGA